MFHPPRVVVAVLAAAALTTVMIVPTEAAVADSVTATVSGVVKAPGGGVPDAPITLDYCGWVTGTTTGMTCFTFEPGQYVYDPAVGSYSGVGIPPGLYGFHWHYSGSAALPDYYSGGVIDAITAEQHYVDLAAGATHIENVQMIAPAAISGHVSGAKGVALPPGSVVYMRNNDSVGSANPVYGTYDASGAYAMSGLAPGSYVVMVEPPLGWMFEAFAIKLIAGQTAHHDATVDREALITGHVYVDDGTGAKPYQGSLNLGTVNSTFQSAADGSYTAYLPDSPTGICLTQTMYVKETCTGVLDVPINGTRSGVDLTATYYGNISALIESQIGGNSPTELTSGTMEVWRRDEGTGAFALYASINDSQAGTIFSGFLPAGIYHVKFYDRGSELDSQWWQGGRFADEATDIHVVAGQTVALGTIVLQSRDFLHLRTSGADRYDGAVKISQADYPDDFLPPDGVPVVYIANGGNYPDALSAGPAAIKRDGVLLLVTPTSIPATVSAELRRLRPQSIVVVGGPASVGDGVFNQLSSFVVDPSDVSRLAGSDRFDASRQVARQTFLPDGAKTVFITTGNNYPDALSAGPAAGSVGAPVILVNGTLPTLDDETAQLLADLGATEVDIAGGTASVSPGIEASLQALVGVSHVHRYAGATRYEASAAIGQAFFPKAETVFLATGTKFPDALAGAPLAGLYGSPIYLSQPDCIPDVVIERIIYGDTQLVWLLGGPASLSDDVYNLYYC